MKTTNDALNIVYAKLKGQAGVIDPVYKLEKPTNQDPDKYFVINALPISKGVMQRCVVNVNFYAKDLGEGIPDTTSLASGTSAAITLLEGKSGTGWLTDFESEQVEFDRDLNRHFSNIRISVKQIN